MLYNLFKKLSFLIIVLLVISCQDDYLVLAPKAKYKIGDDPSWAQKNFDDSTWANQRDNSRDRIFWVRMKVVLPEDPEPFKPQGVLVYAFGAYELYWDNVLIGTNGTPGKENNIDKIGEVDRSFIIPRHLAKKGEHSVAFRVSQKYHPDIDRGFGLVFSNYKNLIQAPLVLTSITYILAGAFFLTAIYFFILYFNNRKFFPVLLFSICSFLFFLLIIIEYVKFYLPIHYSDFYIRLEIIGVLTFLISFLIPVYFSIQFSLPKRKILVPLYFLFLILLYFLNRGHYDFTTKLLIVSMWIASAGIVGHAVFRKKSQAIVVLTTLLINVLLYNFLAYDMSLILSFTLLLLCMFYLLALQIREQRKSYEHSLLQTSRLKNELLKKKIQPHFLMNTLTSLIDWVEESPAKGVNFIEALAEEFNLLNQIEDKKLIPITQEIQLCKSFLNIMKYRKEIVYSWDEKNIDQTKKIPPAIIHTLVENGITHGLPNEHNEIRYRFSHESDSDSTKYILQTIASLRKPDKKIQDGTGNAYIKARLTESYDEKWHFTSQKTTNGWENTITIYH
ncbi:histidine kinase [Aquimarina aggregata]|uniref:histidine kinase n=1 Tax=Aquimarina aggregata TaxID=1642818 RepID=UPI002491DF37|nr:histidine kinase [Aquimarina aggregata]